MMAVFVDGFVWGFELLRFAREENGKSTSVSADKGHFIDIGDWVELCVGPKGIIVILRINLTMRRQGIHHRHSRIMAKSPR